LQEHGSESSQAASTVAKKRVQNKDEKEERGKKVKNQTEKRDKGIKI
jgi:hypothetical protein